MIIRVLLLNLFFYLLAQIGYAQNLVIPKSGKTEKDFIPKGWSIIDSKAGMLNNDTLLDKVLVLKCDEEEMIPDTNRLLLILFKSILGYELSANTPSAIMCKGCGGVFGDPFAGIEIRKNVLIISHYGGSSWRWSYTHKFRYQNNDWYLIGGTKSFYHCTEQCESLDDFVGNYSDANLITGDVLERKIDEKCKLTEIKKKIIKSLITLSKFNIDEVN